LILPSFTRRPSLVTGTHFSSSCLVPRRPCPLSRRPLSPPAIASLPEAAPKASTLSSALRYDCTSGSGLRNNLSGQETMLAREKMNVLAAAVSLQPPSEQARSPNRASASGFRACLPNRVTLLPRWSPTFLNDSDLALMSWTAMIWNHCT
jgi:hypothetical protein